MFYFVICLTVALKLTQVFSFVIRFCVRVYSTKSNDKKLPCNGNKISWPYQSNMLVLTWLVKAGTQQMTKLELVNKVNKFNDK